MDKPRNSVPSNGSVKIGGLWKRSQCISRFTKPNYRHRVFILTGQALSYYCGTVDRVGQLKGRVDLVSVRAVEFVDQSAFNLAHTFQMVYFTKKNGFITLYITASDKRECADWVSSLRQACYFNHDMLMHYHPGAMMKNKWSCCQQQGKTSLGCQPTYHLLTRSSSRYAQMRRKDTLTSSTNSRKRSKTGSMRGERHSLATGTQSEIVPVAKIHGKPGQGYSNSCLDLTDHPPHKLESFTPGTPSSHRSSRLSTEPSFSMGSITLTRVSVLESTVSESGSETESYGEPGQRVEMGQELRMEKRSSSRSQVAPEITSSTIISHFPGPYHLELEEKSLSKSRTSVGNESLNSQRGESPPPVPPRTRYHPTSTSFSGSISFIPSVAPITESREPRARAGMRHSKTFYVVPSSVAGSHTHQCKLSSSMSTLSKPIIEPRVSNSDPNVIHV